MNLDAKGWRKGLNSERAQTVLQDKVQEATDNPQVFEELCASIRSLETGALQTLSHVLHKSEYDATNTKASYDFTHQNGPGWKSLMEHGLIGAFMGAFWGGPIGAGVGGVTGAGLEYAGSSRIAGKTAEKLQKYITMIPRLIEVVDTEMKKRQGEQ